MPPIYFLVQSGLLLLAAYFLGAALACFLRRTIFASDSAEAPRSAAAAGGSMWAPRAPQPVQIDEAKSPAIVHYRESAASPIPAKPQAPVAAASAAPSAAANPTEAKRFERALTTGPATPAPIATEVKAAAAAVATAAAGAVAAAGGAAVARRDVPPAEPPRPARSPDPITIKPDAPKAPQPPVSAPVAAPAVPPAPTPKPGVPMPVSSLSSGPAMVAAPVAPTPALKPAAVPASSPAVAAEVKPAPQAAQQPVAAAVQAPDDLTRIRGIDAKLAATLQSSGVTRFGQIAQWKATEVERVNTFLRDKGRVQRENWIEQAEVLAKGGRTAFAAGAPSDDVRLSAPSADQGDRKALVTPPATAPFGKPVPREATPAAPAAAAPPRPVTPPDVQGRAAFGIQPGRAAVASPQPPPVAPSAADAARAASAAAAAVAAAVATKLPAPAAAAPAAQAPAVPAPAAPVARTVGITRDDLQRIRGINGEVEKLLNVQGVSRYQQVADWTPADVGRFDRLLGYEGRIGRENWIEQARLLVRGGSVAPVPSAAVPAAAAPASAAAAPRPQVAATPTAAPPAGASTAPVAAPPATKVSGGPSEDAARLAAGLAPLPQAPRPTPPAPTPPLKAPASAPSQPTPAATATAQTVASAAIAAASAAAGAVRAATTAPTPTAPTPAATPAPAQSVPSVAKPSAPPAAAATPAPVAPSGPPTTPNLEAAAPQAAPPATPAVAAPAPAAPPKPAAPATTADVPPPPPPPKVAVTASAPVAAPAPAPRASEPPALKQDLSSLRSVKSEGMRGGEPADLTRRTAAIDDLKRIRGIGVLIEKKLNSMGVTSYAQVAAWTAGDIDRVSQALDFKGRIEREAWVEQARILASGGHTDFSRRVDRGEVDSSKGPPKA